MLIHQLRMLASEPTFGRQRKVSNKYTILSLLKRIFMTAKTFSHNNSLGFIKQSTFIQGSSYLSVWREQKA